MTTPQAERSKDHVVVSGPDTWPFLQSLLSQDVEAMADGEQRATLLLTAQGKVDVAGTIERRGDDAVISTDPGWGAHLAEALGRYKIRTKVEIAAEPAADSEPSADAERSRIDEGVPRMGFELDDSLIPQEAFLDRTAVSFTKGCFVGQELVCRIDTRGHVNRYLRHVRAADPSVVPARGAAIMRDGKQVGTITSSAPGIALALVRKEVEPPAQAEVDGQAVTVEALPDR
jgi:folate-binding protein YgfZ